MSRWIEIYATTPSGKTLFVCKMCGRQSPTPDKECSEAPHVASWKPAFSCSVLEEVEEAVKESEGEVQKMSATLYSLGQVELRWVTKDGRRWAGVLSMRGEPT